MNHYADILRMARAGNPARALRLFAARGYDDIGDDPKILTLKGRLLKDQAFGSSASDRARLLQQAAAAYLAAFALNDDSYPLINAATLKLLAGDQDSAQTLAAKTLQLLDEDPHQGETPYWREATRAEAFLLLQQVDKAEQALAAGVAKLPLAHEDRSATIGQFERIMAASDLPSHWLEQYRVPPCLFFSGMIELQAEDPDLQGAIAEAVGALQPSYAFGALAAGADILLGEAARDAGAQLHIVLPAGADAFRSRSVTPFGKHWEDRFEKLLADADTVDVWPQAAFGGIEDLTYRDATHLAGLVTIGACLRQADTLRSHAKAITIVAPGEGQRELVAVWEAGDHHIDRIETPRNAPLASPSKAPHPAEILGLLVIHGGNHKELHALCSAHGVKLESLEHEAIVAGPVANTFSLAKAYLAQHAMDCGSFVTGLVSDAFSEATLLDQARLLAVCAKSGGLAGDQQSALIARALDNSARIQELGEVSSLTGPVSLWSIDFALR